MVGRPVVVLLAGVLVVACRPAQSAVPAQPRPVLDRIHAADALSCGVAKEEEDYSRAEDHGNRAAFDIDLCKAVAVAVLGPGSRLVVKSYPDEPAARKALAAGEIDLLATASLSVANAASGLLLSPPVLLDGQSFLFPNNAGVHSAADLANKKICFLTGSVAENGLHRYAAQHNLSYTWYPFSEAGEMEAAFFTRNCDAVSGDLTSLANIRGINGAHSADYTILSQTIRQDPLAMASPGNDVAFSTVVRWTVETLLNAEALGVTESNVGSLAASTHPELQQLLGQPYGTGTMLGLDPHWGARR